MSCIGFIRYNEIVAARPLYLNLRKCFASTCEALGNSRPLIIVPGATGKIGNVIIDEAGRNSYQIFAYSRKQKKILSELDNELKWKIRENNLIKWYNYANYFFKNRKLPADEIIKEIDDKTRKINRALLPKWIETPAKSDRSDPKAWFRDVELQNAIKEANNILVVNAIANATPSYVDGETFECCNETPVLAFANGLISNCLKGKTITFVNISSIAPAYLSLTDRPWDKRYVYARLRDRIDLDLINLFKKHVEKQNVTFRFVSLRPGFVFTTPKKKGDSHWVNTEYAYSPEQLASMCVPCVLGTGTQRTRPVYSEDIAKAIFNITKTNIDGIVDAVGPEVMTQNEMITFFNELIGRKSFSPFSIPYEFAKSIAAFAPKGRLAPYSVAILEDLEKHASHDVAMDKFESLLGERPKSMRDVYKLEGRIFLTNLPLLEHSREIIKNMVLCGQEKKVFFKVARKYAPNFFLNTLKNITPSCLKRFLFQPGYKTKADNVPAAKTSN